MFPSGPVRNLSADITFIHPVSNSHIMQRRGISSARTAMLYFLTRHIKQNPSQAEKLNHMTLPIQIVAGSTHVMKRRISCKRGRQLMTLGFLASTGV